MGFRDLMMLASLAVLTHRYWTLSSKVSKFESHIEFCRVCLREGLIPVWVKVRISYREDDYTVGNIQQLQKKLLRWEMRKWFKKKHIIHLKINIIRDILQGRMSELRFSSFVNSIKLKTEILRHMIRRTHQKKIQKLRENARVHVGSLQQTKVKFHPRVLNLSQTTFNEDENKLLNMGLKFSMTIFNKSKIVENLVVAVETLFRTYRFQNLFPLRNNVISVLSKFKRSNSLRANTLRGLNDSLRSIREKISTNNLLVSKADKGNCLVIMNKEDYTRRVHDFLNENNFIEKSTKFVNEYNKNFKSTLAEFGPTVCESWRTLVPMNFNIPRLYGLPKIHKDNIPIRPVVSFCGSLAYKTSQFLCKFLTENLNFQSVYSVKNSLDLINKIKDVKLEHNTLLASFDVKNLFTTVPLPQTLQVFKNLLIQSDLPDEICNAVYRLTKLCLEQNFFVFDGKIYSQEDGLSMGNGLSPLFAEIFMAYMELKLILTTKNPFRQKIIFWHRYVDDVIVGFDGSREELLELFNWINNLHSNINFTLEVEENNSLNFLDLTIHRTNQGLAFDIFRKPTQTDHSINNLSCHQLGHKLSAFKAYIHRMFRTPLDRDRFLDEVVTLKHIATQNGYKPNIIDKLITKYQNKLEIEQLQFSDNHPTVIDKKYISIPFYGNISHKIGNLFRQYSDFEISFKSSNTLGQLLVHNKDPVHFLNKSGVYRLKCGDCNTLYVGRSGRSINSRINEHLTSFRVNSNNNSAFGVHLRVQNHNFNKEEDVKLLHNCDFGRRLEVLEEIEIYKHLNISNMETLNSTMTNSFQESFRLIDKMALIMA